MASSNTMAERRRTVLVLGRTGAGKSTLGNQLIGNAASPPFRVGSKLAACTFNPKAATGFHHINGTHCEFQVIDTPGWFHAESDTKEILQKTVNFLEEKAPDGVNVVLLAWHKDRMTQADAGLFKFIKREFQLESRHSSCFGLAVTGFTSEKAEKRKEVIEDIRSNSVMRTLGISEALGNRIIDLCFPKLDDFDDDVRELYQRKIDADAVRLREFVARPEFDEKKLRIQILSLTFWQKFLRFLGMLPS
eukprot:m.109029 g.109029  ORF g.109029 m.109029 type:complete len:248 (+) comp37334_c1_seq2:645-1388(+)